MSNRNLNCPGYARCRIFCNLRLPMNRAFTFSLALALVSLSACQYLPLRRTEAPKPATNKFSDGTLRQIYTLQDERNTTALLPYLTHASPEARILAALAFASVQDTAANPHLHKLLTDADAGVRAAAAYAIGQTGGGAYSGIGIG